MSRGSCIRGYIGSMKSSKSWELAKIFNKITRGGKDTSRVAVIIPASDTRESTYGSKSRKVEVIHATHVIQSDALLEIDADEAAKKYDYFFFDEAHFIKNAADLMIQLYLHGCQIFFAALDQKSDSQPWPETTKILAIATKYKKLTALCDTCSREASFTRIKPEFRDLVDTNGVLIGDQPYTVLCLYCALKYDSPLK